MCLMGKSIILAVIWRIGLNSAYHYVMEYDDVATNSFTRILEISVSSWIL